MTKNKKISEPLKKVLGPIWNLYVDEAVSEIIIDAFDDVYYSSREGIKAAKVFKTSEDLDKLVDRLLRFSNKSGTNELSYFIQLDDYTRINLVLHPLAVKGHSLVLSKLPKQEVTFEDLITWKALDEEGNKLLHNILHSDKGFLVAGNMGSGKTTLLNTLVNAIPEPMRVVTLERVPDLVLTRPKVCRLQSQTQKAHEMIELIDIAERMRGDYVVLSECSGPEVGPFLEMVRNNCTGVALTTGDSIQDALKRLISKVVISSEGHTLEEARYGIAQTFSYIIFQERRADGRRIISGINEISYSEGELKLKSLYQR
jgi:pilus assembly protein CpaF